MKKGAIVLLLMCLVCAVSVQGFAAEEKRMFILSGTVVAGETITVLAPFGGIVSDFSLRKGDFVNAEDTLFTITTTKVYAPCDGIIGSVRAQVGDETSFVQDQYGALLYIEPLNRFLIKTDTKYAFNADDNKLIHVGETVYIGSRSSSERTGIGFITSVDDNGYTVEVTEGNLILGDSISVFRSRDFSNESKIGSGTTILNPNVPITSEGSIFRLYATQGREVARGDLLLETVNGSIAYNPFPTNRVLAGRKAIVASVDINAGSNVSKNQLMATLYPMDKFQISVNILESDLKDIEKGDSVRIELSNFFDQESMTGVISSISGLGATESGETEYTVYIDFAAGDFIRLGMAVNVYFNE